ncbi:MAG: phage protein Gp27 family protein [Thermodesulfobacteriota bacterium]
MTGVPRRRHSKVDKLPDKVAGQVRRMILEGEATYEEILAWLADKGYPDISLSSLGRYAKHVRSIQMAADRTRTILEEVRATGLDLDEAADTIAGQKLLELLADLDLEEEEEIGAILPQLVKIQNLITQRRRLALAQGQDGPVMDRPRCFLEDLELTAEVLKEADPEGLKVLARNWDLIVARGKERFGEKE